MGMWRMIENRSPRRERGYDDRRPYDNDDDYEYGYKEGYEAALRESRHEARYRR